MFYIEALALPSNHLRFVQQWSSHYHQNMLFRITQHRKYVLPFFFVGVSFDCIRPIVTFYVPVVLRVWIGIMEYCRGTAFVFGLTWKSLLNQQWHCSVFSLGNLTRQFFEIPPRQHRASLPVRSVSCQGRNMSVDFHEFECLLMIFILIPFGTEGTSLK